jgi:hypothetical protein
MILRFWRWLTRTPLDVEVDDALRLYSLKNNSPADMARWIEFRNAGLRKRGHVPLS